MTLSDTPAQIHLPNGFSFSSVAAGIKASGRPDLALVTCSAGTRAAAVFTKNRVVAAPVQVGRAALKRARGRVRALVVNSGNANCATGAAGMAACRQVCREAARHLGVNPTEVFPSSTGIIGVPLPAEKIVVRLPELVAQQAATEEAACQFAQTIMTTDMRPKLASVRFRSRGTEVRLLGIAKGAGMIHPQLATMLVYVLTDVAARTTELKRHLVQTSEETFNCISIDGDTSTNDTVLLLASGQADVRLDQCTKAFNAALLEVCRSLARQIVRDGEGAQHVIRLSVEQAKTREEAKQVARAIAHSALVKTAWAGADPNWGRILAAIGYSGAPVNPARVNIFIGAQQVCRNGSAAHFDQKEAHFHLAQSECDIRVQLGRGRSRLHFYTTDLTAEYVRINADYST
ncbi:MAG: bifunctional glutamate N-acetyltransferase/amino-acid acetyltransferase ArgJ [Acidobacteria bacterium]|nr:MAG: bifunctional glutamate N-acetyltransferase/amino-acid acetyltransferase ArgJ [Acidobacteriota bacterium]